MLHDTWLPFAKHGMKETDDWASIILVSVFPNGTFTKPVEDASDLPAPIGYIFVIEPERRDPKLKLPGGKKLVGETPLTTALRELEEEIGIPVPKHAMRFIGTAWRLRPLGHWSCLFLAHVEEREVPWMHSLHPGNEGEVPKFLTTAEFQAACENRTFLDEHRWRLHDAGLIDW